MSCTIATDRRYVVDAFHAGVRIPASLPSGNASDLDEASKHQDDEGEDDVVPPRPAGAGEFADILDRTHKEGKELQIEME
jgi:hypothetical protein